MSFFKRIMGLFREEIDEEFEQPVELPKYEETPSQRADELPVPPVFHERPQETQEMKTKIAYRYPSRELYPSRKEKVQQRPRRERRLQLEKQNFSDNRREQEYTYHQEEPAPSKQPVKASTTYRPSPGPFKPTEIPSPVYGFHKRPVSKNETVTKREEREELPAAIDEERVDVQQVVIDKKEEIAFKPTDSVQTEEPSSKLPKEEPGLLFKREEMKKDIDRKPEGKEELPAAIDEERVDVQQVVIDKKEEIAFKPTDSVQTEEPSSKLPKEEPGLLFKREEMKKDIDRKPEGKEELPAAIDEERVDVQQVVIDKKEEIAFKPTDSVQAEEPSPKLPKEEPLLLFKPEEKKKAFDIEAVSSFAVKEEVTVMSVEPLYEEEASVLLKEESDLELVMEEKPAPPENPDGKLPAEKNFSRAEERSRKRRQTPFNVIMSKQDRELWKKRVEEPQVLVEKPVEEPANDFDNSVQPYEKEPEGTLLPSVAVEESVEGAMDNEEPDYYVFPYETYLSPPIIKEVSGDFVESQSEVLNETFKNFNVKASVVNVTVGPSVTRFEVEPERGVKVSKITNLTDDIKRSLAARNIRIEAPIPGTQVIGIEVPNKESRPVQISEIISSPAFKESSSPLTSALGLDISGEPVVLDLKKMPHGLIAGATGSGKSVCINSILVSLLYKAAPHELKLMLIDPKMVELAPYNGIPHLVSPVITDVKAATAALKWAVEEMERRYELFVHSGVRDITKYNEKAAEHGRKSEHLPYIVIIIDELADLMMMSPADVEEAICRIAQKARACGIHLIVATQRPSVDVITGLIKANIPTRIAFSVSSQVDSRTIIDAGGAEKLLGRGDMLFLNNGASETVRLQGTFVSDDEIDTIVAHVQKEQEPNYLFEQEELLQKAAISETEDELFPEACEFVVQQGGASTSLLQRHFKIGYNRAARLIEMMETQGFVSGQRAGRPREVLLTEEELQALHESNAN
ncbi:DNA translocase FtsK [Bacillus sp. PK3_68]|uniref:DNA translocase FtsK n=1 Tax=Bacillus sp. PK3_68 TaxID=2027408 RepID=UPI000E70EC66|nr:DNA translocase FtsK [Bacillus sp. PK3_68]RJS60048.1 hypothetical protein CJ483_08110 [Bacillus sp. PK3_68]